MVGVSAPSILTAPLTGFSVLAWKNPNKTTSFQLIPAELCPMPLLPISGMEIW